LINNRHIDNIFNKWTTINGWSWEFEQSIKKYRATDKQINDRVNEIISRDVKELEEVLNDGLFNGEKVININLTYEIENKHLKRKNEELKEEIKNLQYKLDECRGLSIKNINKLQAIKKEIER
jgi:cell division protein FtsB